MRCLNVLNLMYSLILFSQIFFHLKSLAFYWIKFDLINDLIALHYWHILYFVYNLINGYFGIYNMYLYFFTVYHVIILSQFICNINLMTVFFHCLLHPFFCCYKFYFYIKQYLLEELQYSFFLCVYFAHILCLDPNF